MRGIPARFESFHSVRPIRTLPLHLQEFRLFSAVVQLRRAPVVRPADPTGPPESEGYKCEASYKAAFDDCGKPVT